MKKKKVLFVCQNIGAFKERILPVFMFLKNKEYEIHLVCDEELDIAFVEKKYIIRFFDDFSSIKNGENLKSLSQILQEEKYDVVHSIDNLSSYFSYICIKKSKVKYTEFFAYLEDIKKHRIIFLDVLKNADTVIVNNMSDYELVTSKKYNSNVKLIDDLAIDFRKFNNIDFSKIKEDIKQKYSLDGDKKYVTIIDANYNLNYALKVIKEISIQNSNIKFLIKDLSPKLETALLKQGVLHLVEKDNNLKILDMLFISDSVLFCNIYEYDLNLFVYTLMIGIPVIVPNKKFISSYITELKNGYYYYNGNVQQTILAIGRSINIPEVIKKEIISFNYSLIKKFSCDRYVKNINLIYDEVRDIKVNNIYVVKDLKRKDDTERLLCHIKDSKMENVLILVTEKSKNDEKLESLGITVKHMNIKTFNEKYKFKKFLFKLFEENKNASLSVYGKMNTILLKNKIDIANKYDVIVRYFKID